MVLTSQQTERISYLLNKILEKKKISQWYNVSVPDMDGKRSKSQKSKPLSEICPDVNNALEKITGEDKNFQRNCLLKETLPEEFKKLDEEKSKELAVWIIRRWGGINRGFKNESNSPTAAINLVTGDIERARKGEIDDTIQIASPIPSRSKVLSFFNPEKYMICDSRVLFSLNWLIYITADKNNEEQVRLFPSLMSGNNGVNEVSTPEIDFPNDVVVRFKSYAEYCTAIAEITDSLKKLPDKNNWHRYYTEMLLFAIAPADSGIIPKLVKTLKEKNDFSFGTAMQALAE